MLPLADEGDASAAFPPEFDDAVPQGLSDSTRGFIDGDLIEAFADLNRGMQVRVICSLTMGMYSFNYMEGGMQLRGGERERERDRGGKGRDRPTCMSSPRVPVCPSAGACRRRHEHTWQGGSQRRSASPPTSLLCSLPKAPLFRAACPALRSSSVHGRGCR